jgi:methyl-accepting chemotaxis protein
MSDFLNLMSALFAGYVVKAWPFLLVHILVFYLVSRSWHRLVRERQALESWDVPSVKPSEREQDSAEPSLDDNAIAVINSSQASKLQVDGQRETIVVLEQFVDESRVMGAKGLFVPMTDFSDRLDSAVEGKIAELHERTNLFLYVGIAGTMFGVFEFAHRSYSLIVSGAAQSDKLVKLGEYLSASMSRAFPVGFFGLVFTFIAQIVATRPEQRLREELSEATRKALEARKAATHSQGELIQRASAKIVKAMRPLENLERTLSESLKPVVEVFGKRLDKSLGLIEKQFQRLETTSAGLQTAVTDVKTAVSSIANATKSLNSLIEETPKVINGLVMLEKQHETSLAKSDQLLEQHFTRADQLSKELQTAVENLSKLSERVIEEATAGIARIETASVGTWTTAAEQLRKQIEAELAEVFKQASNEMQEINTAVSSALAVMNGIGVAATTSIAELGKLAPEVSANYKVSLDNVAQESSNHWRHLSENVFKAVENQYLDHVNKVRDGTLTSSAALKAAADEWWALAGASQTVLKDPVKAAVAEAKTDMREYLRSLDGNVEARINQFSEKLIGFSVELTKLQNSTAELVNKVRSINNDLSDWAAKAAPLTRDIRTATESIRRQSETQAGIVRQLNTAAEKFARVANRPAPTAHAGDGPRTVFRPPRRERTWWKPNTWFGRQ